MAIIHSIAATIYMGIIYMGVPGVFLYEFLYQVATKGI